VTTLADPWPDDLVRILAQRQGAIFIGSGAAASCSPRSDAHVQDKFPTWHELVIDLASKCNLSEEDKNHVETLLERHAYPLAAQVIVDEIDRSEFGGLIRRNFDRRDLQPSDIYEQINLLDQPIVMTTNYDRMYERYWDELAPAASDPDGGLITRNYMQEAASHVRSPSRVLLKLHGCVSDADNVILSKSQYHRARHDHANFFRIVGALLLTRPTLFIGCGFMGDPDLEFLLEDATFMTDPGNPHYALVPRGRHQSETKALRSTANVQLIEYDQLNENDHSAVQSLLAALVSRVDGARAID